MRISRIRLGSVSGGITVVLGQAIETDLAQSVGRIKELSVNQVTELDS